MIFFCSQQNVDIFKRFALNLSIETKFGKFLTANLEFSDTNLSSYRIIGNGSIQFKFEKKSG